MLSVSCELLSTSPDSTLRGTKGRRRVCQDDPLTMEKEG
jgi:hypothetical protein